MHVVGLAIGLVLVVTSLVLIRAVDGSPGLGWGMLLVGLAVLAAVAEHRGAR